MSEAKTSRRWGGVALVLVAILGLALSVRLYRLGDQCYWVDELLTMEDLNARGHQDIFLPRNVLMAHPPSVADPAEEAPWWKMWNGLREESHPPLYFVCCRLWRDCFGSSEAAIRSLSVVFSMIAILSMFCIALDLSGVWPAIWSAALMAFSLPQIAYAQEARNYAMLNAMSLLAALALVRIEKRGMNPWRWLGLTLALLATALTHYFSFGLLVALGVYAVCVLRGNRLRAGRIELDKNSRDVFVAELREGRLDATDEVNGARGEKINRRLIATLAAFVSAATLFLVAWGRNLLLQRSMLLHDFPMYANPEGHTQITLLRAAALPLRQLVGVALSNDLSIAAAIALLVAAILSILFRRRDLLLWWLMLLGAISTVMIIDLARTAEQLTMVKYTLGAGPAACAIAAACVPKRFRRVRHVVPLALLALEIYFLPQAYHDWKGDWAGAAATTLNLTPANDPVVIAGNGTGRPTLSWMYLGMNVYVHPWPRALAISDREPSAELLKVLRKYSQITLVTDCVRAPPGEIVPGFAPAGPPHYFANVGIVWPLVKK